MTADTAQLSWGMPSFHIPSIEPKQGSYPQRSGNRVRPLIGGEPAFQRICEAVESARHSIWVTVAFLDPTFMFPDDRGSLFDVLDRAAARGIDVRALFWRSPVAAKVLPDSHFLGNDRDHDFLRERGAQFKARWDQLDKSYCHHQKTWLIDAGRDEEIAFVGGINLNNSSVSTHPFPLRKGGPTELTQDIYCELAGPSATDVHHNFVQRWNGASERGLDLGAWPSAESVDDLPFPTRPSPRAGDASAQISRTVRRGFYQDETRTPDGKPFPVSSGEYSVMHQYLAAISAARKAIYFENQHFAQPDLFDAIESALARDVQIMAIVPASPSQMLFAERRSEKGALLYDRLTQISEHPNFSLLGIVVDRGDHVDPIYVHTKTAIVDDAWATIGSTNLANRSFFGDTEMNASFWHEETAERFRIDLLSAHHGDDLSPLSMSDSLRAVASRAEENSARIKTKAPIRGHVIQVEARTWATELSEFGSSEGG